MERVIEHWREQIVQAAEARRPLRFRGGGSKDFYGRMPVGKVLETRPYHGIVSYEPTELVVTARGGTPLAELEQALAEQGQALAFEPPHFGPYATLGGCVAAGLSGPRRQAAGPLRDFVLGLKMLDGRGQRLSFGGQVMKNVAGYDVSRLMVGSLGCLGLILEVSLKVLPRPAGERTLVFECGEAEAVKRMNRWAARPLPIVSTCWHEGVLAVRLAGARAGVQAGADRLGGEVMDEPGQGRFWHSVREHTHAFFADTNLPLWRVAVPSTSPPLELDGARLIEWGGGLRWLRTDLPPDRVRDRAVERGGHVTLFRHGDRSGEVFQRPAPALMDIHRRLKAAFDPADVFNPGRLYDGF